MLIATDQRAEPEKFAVVNKTTDKSGYQTFRTSHQNTYRVSPLQHYILLPGVSTETGFDWTDLSEAVRAPLNETAAYVVVQSQQSVRVRQARGVCGDEAVYADLIEITRS